MTACAATLLAACSSEEFPLTHPDGYGEIAFTVGSGNVTRATEGYLPYDYDRDPHTMSVFGWHTLSKTNIESEGNTIFDNVEVTAERDEETSTVSWTYLNKKYWFDYAAFSSFDFFGVMPYNPDATIEAGNTNENVTAYTVTMPVIFEEGAAFAPEETALMCNLPEHKKTAEGIIPFKMDQTLTGYSLIFELGEKMDDLRDFIIKRVKVYGNSLAHSGIVRRTYYWDGYDWTSGPIAWTLTQDDYVDIPSTTDVEIPYKNMSNNQADLEPYYTDPAVETDLTPATPGTLRVTRVPVQWGNSIYVIPVPGFNPTFEVTYDVVVKNEDGVDIVTRRDVVSTIQFTDDFFTVNAKETQQGMGKMGHTSPIRIKIVPEHLYVLADADQTFGYLPVSD